jgi:hypothetical protein
MCSPGYMSFTLRDHASGTYARFGSLLLLLRR